MNFENPDSKNANSEKLNINKLENIEVNNEQRELSADQKKILGEIWTEMIVDNAEVPENIVNMNNDEIKKWLFESTMKDIGVFAEELGLKIDTELSNKIKEADNINEKAALELEYVIRAHEQVDNIVKNFGISKNKSTKWDSWPKRMRETQEFNCVGATLLGMYLLEKGGIKSSYGNPAGHVLNIVQLSNDEWWYVDFRNGKNNVIKIEPEQIKIADILVLRINQPNIDYKLIPLCKNEESVVSILGNIGALKKEAEDRNISNENIGKKEAVEYLKKYSENYNKTDLSGYVKKLYPDLIKVDESEEVVVERKRMDSVVDCMKNEIKIKIEAIRNLFYKNDISVLDDVSSELKKSLESILLNLNDLREKNQDIYREEVDKIVSRLENL